MASFSYETEEEWKAIRQRHVGGSEVAALFGEHPYGLTKWQLHMLKTGKLPDVFENVTMTQGKFFEPAIAAYAEAKFSVRLRKVRRYLSADDVVGLGSSLDYEQYGDGALLPCEIKWSLWGSDWDWESDELTHVPDGYFLQVQHQLACMPSAPSAMLIAFTGGDLKRMLIPRDERLIAAIKQAVTTFWADVASGTEPPVDFSVDADAVTRLAYIRKLRTLTMTPDKAPLFERWRTASRAAKDAEVVADAAKAEILKAVVDAGEGPDTGLRVTCGDWSVALSKVADNPGKEITADMVGERVGVRRGFLRTQLTHKDDKKK